VVPKLLLVINVNHRLNILSFIKDLVGLGNVRGVERDCIHEIFIKKLGSGGSTKFWLDRLVGLAPLCKVFPRLFQVSLQPSLTIKEMGAWEGEKWLWPLTW
jgi:hypothetical protein